MSNKTKSNIIGAILAIIIIVSSFYAASVNLTGTQKKSSQSFFSSIGNKASSIIASIDDQPTDSKAVNQNELDRSNVVASVNQTESKKITTNNKGVQ
jgi:hypothetical protein